MHPTSIDNPDCTLNRLLGRSDIWRGQTKSLDVLAVMNTGYEALDAALLNGGWPTRSLVEVCQKGFQQQEWRIFEPVLKAGSNYVVLLNPPLMPFCQAMIQGGIDLDRVIVVRVSTAADFLASFVELARTASCDILLAWQQPYALSYTELRKCLLATNDGSGLCVLFRAENARQQSSPATLRLLSEITSSDIQLTLFKQKGTLEHSSQPIKISLPKAWTGLMPYHLLDQIPLPGKPDTTQRKPATVTPLRRSK